MAGPQIPYVKIPEIPLGLPDPFNSIKPFGLLVATGVYLGSQLALRRAKQRRLDVAKMNTFIFYVVGIGFIGAHVFDALFYTPERLKADPLYIFKLHMGLSSYGGFIGAMSGALIYKYVKKDHVLPYVDTVCSAFPFAWVFGRAGCASVHDHLGKKTESWLGVQSLNPRVRSPTEWGFIWDAGQTVGQFDLGLIEMVLTIPLATAFFILWRQKPRAWGFYAGWQCILYAPVRFILDFFRVEPGGVHEADPRYGGLTPAQWACFGLVAIGVLILRMSRAYTPPATWAEVEALPMPGDAPATDDEDEEGEEPGRPVKTKKSTSKAALVEEPSEETTGEETAPVKRRRKKKKKKPVADDAERPTDDTADSNSSSTEESESKKDEEAG
ncbi:MAG: prolipoprotein diacylglyceryl transferase family protein [Polyangiaceae bacterium]